MNSFSQLLSTGFILLLTLIPLAHAEQSNWKSFNYTAIRIIDGDTLEATDGNIKFKVRIVGMDAPEHDQAFGKVSKAALGDFVLNKKINLQPVKQGLDRYGRTLSQVYVDGQDVSLLMIQKGLATYYRPECKDYPESANRYNYDPRSYVQAETQAKQAKLNIWSVAIFELPCTFRHKAKH